MDAILATLRVYRIGPFSAFDTVGAYLVVAVVAPWLTRMFAKIHISISPLQWLSLTLPLALAAHLLAGVNSPFTKMFLDSGNIVAKVIVMVMVIVGLKDVALSLLRPRHQ